MKNFKLKREQILEDPRLGKIPDSELGEKYGVSKTFVCKLRNKHGVPFTWKRGAGPGRESPHKDRVLQYKSLLGVYSDRSIALWLNVNKETVRRVRLKLEIDPGKTTLKFYPISDDMKLMQSWGTIPERVGLTKNQWRKQCGLNQMMIRLTKSLRTG